MTSSQGDFTKSCTATKKQRKEPHICHHNILKLTNNRLTSSKNDRIQNAFLNINTVLALRQPKNLIRHLTTAKFQSNPSLPEPVLFKCENKRCKICRLYIQQCTSFKTKMEDWNIQCHITCNSRNVLYYLVCNVCEVNTESYMGKSVKLRLQINRHISESRMGNGNDKFDKHVYNCRHKHNNFSYTFDNI